MKILLVHPEGNINYNPNLAGIAELLAEAGHEVTYVCRKRPAIDQRPVPAGIPFQLVDHPPCGGRFLFEQVGRFTGFDLVIAIDRGILEGAEIARINGAQLGLISYEIFSPEETPRALKEAEVVACSHLSFAVAPDAMRAGMLSRANEIDPGKIIHIPVAGRGCYREQDRSRAIHDAFDLEAGCKTVLCLGSLAPWTGVPYLIESTRHWPENWVLILHGRFGVDDATRAQVQALPSADHIIISPRPFQESDELSRFIAAANLGVAIYMPTYENEWLGSNIAQIGLASGKIAAYLQHGVPVATPDLGQISHLIGEYGAGYEFALDQPFVPRDVGVEARERCLALFEDRLDLERYKRQLLDIVDPG